MTKPGDTLTILGDENDVFDGSHLNDSGKWSQTSKVDDGESTTYTYSSSDNITVNLTVDEFIKAINSNQFKILANLDSINSINDLKKFFEESVDKNSDARVFEIISYVI